MLIDEKKYVRVNDLTGTFAGLMDLYERNYISLRRLLPDLPEEGVWMVSEVPSGLSLYAQVNSRFRYTTELTLTYVFGAADNRRLQPNLKLRIYHDARQAEVMSADLRHWPVFKSDYCTELYARWRVNRFLCKWLSYCLHQGHCFSNTPAAMNEFTTSE